MIFNLRDNRFKGHEEKADHPPAFSVVIPVYNEEESVEPLYKELCQALDPLKQSYEMIFVDDGSSDRTAHILESLQGKDSRIHIITLPQRHGQTYALRQGLGAVLGKAVVTLDADLQNDPADIPKMLKELNKGYDVICGWRYPRQDQPLKVLLSRWGNTFQKALTGLTIHDVSCTLRVYSKDCWEKIPLNWEGQHRFIPLCLALQGFRVGEVVSHHRQRRFGTSKYNHGRIFKVIMDFGRILWAKGKK